jgi:hypothetical protein
MALTVFRINAFLVDFKKFGTNMFLSCLYHTRGWEREMNFFMIRHEGVADNDLLLLAWL